MKRPASAQCPTPSRWQFSVRSLLHGMIWLALILAICAEHQRTAARQREAIQSLKAAGVLPAGRIGWQVLPARPAPPAP